MKISDEYIREHTLINTIIFIWGLVLLAFYKRSTLRAKLTELTKEKTIGIFCLIIGVLAFIDTVHPLSVGIYHLHPYFVTIALIGIGWLKLHGPEPLIKRWTHHAHILSLLALLAIGITLWMVTRK